MQSKYFVLVLFTIQNVCRSQTAKLTCALGSCARMDLQAANAAVPAPTIKYVTLSGIERDGADVVAAAAATAVAVDSVSEGSECGDSFDVAGAGAEEVSASADERTGNGVNLHGMMAPKQGTVKLRQ